MVLPAYICGGVYDDGIYKARIYDDGIYAMVYTRWYIRQWYIIQGGFIIYHPHVYNAVYGVYDVYTMRIYNSLVYTTSIYTRNRKNPKQLSLLLL